MITRGHHPAMAHFQRYGPLAYRLALAMTGDKDLAARILEETFAGFAREGARWPQWHGALAAVHTRCLAYFADNPSAKPATKPTQPELTGDDESTSLPAATVHGALSALSPEDRETLWGVLTATNLATVSWESLADSLRRLEIAITNEDIPAEEEPEWRE